MKLVRVLVAGVVLMMARGVPAKSPDRAHRSFRAGQRWAYATPRGEEASSLIVLKVETLPGVGEVVHISVEGVNVKNSRSPEGKATRLPHLPFAKDALDESVTKLLGQSVAMPDFADGYAQWRAANGGAFTTSVAAAVGFAEHALNP